MFPLIPFGYLFFWGGPPPYSQVFPPALLAIHTATAKGLPRRGHAEERVDMECGGPQLGAWAAEYPQGKIRANVAVGQNQGYHFGAGAPPILVHFSARRETHPLTIWRVCVCVQRKAGALQQVFLPCGTRVSSAERVYFSRCSYHSACVRAALSGCTSAGVLTIWHLCVCAVTSGCTSAGVLTILHACVQCREVALQRVFLPFGMRVAVPSRCA